MDAPSFKRITDAGPVPCAEKRPVATTRHGVTLIDDYAWLRAPNWQAVMRNPVELDGAIRFGVRWQHDHRILGIPCDPIVLSEVRSKDNPEPFEQLVAEAKEPVRLK